MELRFKWGRAVYTALVVLLALAVLPALAACGGGGGKNTTITAAELKAAIQDDIEKARKTYSEKNLTVSGYFVAEIDFGSYYNLYLGVDDTDLGNVSQWSIECVIPKESVEGIEMGAELVISGLCSSITDAKFYMKSCKLVEVLSPGGG